MQRTSMNQAFLGRQADQLERALHALTLPARVYRGEVGNRWVRYHLSPSVGTQATHVVQAAQAVADAIGVGEVRVAGSVEGLTIDVPVNRGGGVRLLPLLHSLPNLSAMTAIVGMLASGNPLLLNLNRSSTWNLMAIGPSGCGKSELLRTLVISLALTSRRSQLNLLGIDIGGRELAMVEALPHALTDLATEAGFARDLIFWLRKEIERRRTTGTTRPHLVLVMDDLAWVSQIDDLDVLITLRYILEGGAEAGVHILAATKDPLLSPLQSFCEKGGVVKASPVQERTGSRCAKAGRFRFVAGSKVSIADVAWMGVGDLDTAVRLAGSGWRAARLPPLKETGDQR